MEGHFEYFQAFFYTTSIFFVLGVSAFGANQTGLLLSVQPSRAELIESFSPFFSLRV